VHEAQPKQNYSLTTYFDQCMQNTRYKANNPELHEILLKCSIFDKNLKKHEYMQHVAYDTNLCKYLEKERFYH
jgi:hypothetical protein